MSVSSDGCSLTVHERTASASSWEDAGWGSGWQLSLVPSTLLPSHLLGGLAPGSRSGDSEFLLTFPGRHKAKMHQERQTQEPHHSRTWPRCSLAAIQEHSENPGPELCPPNEGRDTQGCLEPLPLLLFQHSHQSRWKRYFFNFLDDITCILNNNEPINYKKLNNQKNMYVKFGVFINE